MPHTGGFPHRRKFREQADAPVVARLRAAGAIVLGVGNTPGPFYWLETNNRIYGRTSNAYDPTRTAGGSSGGDAVMVGSGGAPIALGSDMGGSIRVPAFVNGIFGHLPSPGLVPITGHFPMPSGEIRRTLFIGPLARRASDLAPVLRIISGPDGEDPNVVPMALGDPNTVSIAGMRVLVSRESSTLPLRPVIAQAVERAAGLLDDAGAKVEEVSLRSLRWALAAVRRDRVERVRPVRVVVGADRADAARDGPRAAAGRGARRRAAAGRGRAAAVPAHPRRAPPGRRGAARVGHARRHDRATACCSTRRSRGSRRGTAPRCGSPGWPPTPRCSTCSGCPRPRCRSG